MGTKGCIRASQHMWTYVCNVVGHKRFLPTLLDRLCHILGGAQAVYSLFTITVLLVSVLFGFTGIYWKMLVFRNNTRNLLSTTRNFVLFFQLLILLQFSKVVNNFFLSIDIKKKCISVMISLGQIQRKNKLAWSKP